jgi:hypothetical protein
LWVLEQNDRHVACRVDHKAANFHLDFHDA